MRKRQQRREEINRYCTRYGYPRSRRNQALVQVLHLWYPTTAERRINFRVMRREDLSYP